MAKRTKEGPLISRRQFLQGCVAAAPLLARPDKFFTWTAEMIAVLDKRLHPLTPEQEAALYWTSQKYIAQTHEDAIRVAREINFKPTNNFEDPSNMCGPLAIDQMVKAEVLPLWTNVADFWLLNPRVNSALLERTFPKENYTWFATDKPIWEFDFVNNPLYVGDFLYTFGGTFEHMLVVNLIDEQGRASAVTNVLTGRKTKSGIDEINISMVQLYNPKMPKMGFFYWGDGDYPNNLTGYTGKNGFALFRRGFNTPAASEVVLSSEFGTRLESLLASSQGEWHVNIRDIGGVGDRDIFIKDEYTPIHPASAIKVAIGMAFFYWMETMGWVGELDKQLNKGPGNGRTYGQLLRAMLVKSEEGATKELTDLLQKSLPGGIKAVLEKWGVKNTTVVPRKSTSNDMMVLMESLYRGKFVNNSARTKLLGWLAEYTDSDKTRLGIIKNKLKLPAGWKVNLWNKRGSIAEGITVVADTAVVEFTKPDGKKRVFYLGLFGYPGKGATYEKLEKTIEDVATLFAASVTVGII